MQEFSAHTVSASKEAYGDFHAGKVIHKGCQSYVDVIVEGPRNEALLPVGK